MFEVKGNLFTIESDAICITTNGVVRSNGLAVMGAGIAKQARDRYIGIDTVLGNLLTLHGNHVFLLGKDNKKHILSFPTKNHWKSLSDINLIIRSCNELIVYIDNNKLSKVVMVRPGCGCGGLSWEKEVKPAINHLLDSRFIIVSH